MKSKPTPEGCETARPRPDDRTPPNIFPSHVALAPRARRRDDAENEARPHVALASCIIAVSASALSAIGVLVAGGGIWRALLVFVVAQVAIFTLCILLCVIRDSRRSARAARGDSIRISSEWGGNSGNCQIDKIEYK